MSEFRERPILFSTDMVRAILDGRKTQTRRVIKPADLEKSTLEYGDCTKGLVCPYGRPGDRLWVRETFLEFVPEHRLPSRYAYRADVISQDCELARQAYIKAGYPYKWKSSRFMPRAACRLILEITSVSVETVKDISPEAAAAEGVVLDTSRHTPGQWLSVTMFRELWDSINAKRGYSWESNPWVWVVKFKALVP